MGRNQVPEELALFPDTYAEYVSEGAFIRYPHIQYVAGLMADAIYEGNARIVFSMPPRHGKSVFSSYWVPVWYLERFRRNRVILTSYAAELAQDFGRTVRNEINTNPRISVKLRQDSKAADRFHTPEGGGMVTAGVNGPITGRGANLFLIDDPYKNYEDAMSEVYNRSLRNWYLSVARTRLEPGGSMILIMTRWQENDLATFLIKEHGFQEIKIPAIAESEDPLGRLPGQALCPQRYTETDLQEIRRDVGPYVWNALYQQNPVPIEGGLIKRSWWKFYRELPMNITRKVQFWDCAQKPGVTNDWTVCATWGETPIGYYLLDLLRIKVEFPGLQAALKAQYHKHMPHAVVIEDKSSGSSLIQYARAETRMPILPYDPKQRDKVIRAAAAAPTIEAGNCHLPESAPWLDDFIIEHERFPMAGHDDQVDTTSMAIEFFRSKLGAARPQITLLG